MEEQQKLTPKEASKVLQVPLMTVYSWCYKDLVEAEKDKAGHWHVNVESLCEREGQRRGKVVVNLLSLNQQLTECLLTVQSLLDFEKKRQKAKIRVLEGVKE